MLIEQAGSGGVLPQFGADSNGLLANGVIELQARDHDRAILIRIFEIATTLVPHDQAPAADFLAAEKMAKDVHLAEKTDGRAGQTVTTTLVSGKRLPVQQQHPSPPLGEKIRCRRPTWSRPNHDHLRVERAIAAHGI